MNENRSQSTANALRVLQLVGDEPGISLAAIARRLERSKPAVHRFVHTLIDYGFVRENDEQSGYLLGYRVIALGRAAERSSSLREVSVGPMRKLRDDVNETVHLAVLDTDAPVYIEKVESTQVLRHWTRLGERLPLHCGAASKCLAAFAFDSGRIRQVLHEQQQPLTRYTDRTVTDVATFLADLDRIRETGLATSRSEFYDGITGISVPIYRATDPTAVAAVSLAGPSTRFTPESIDEWSAKLRATAREIEQQL